MGDFDKEKYNIEDLLGLMNFLRSGEGCPWDREQTHQSIKKNVLEEAYEVIDAIDSNLPDRLYDELGDLLLQVVFHSQIAKEANEFDFEKITDHLCKKLISRHTHIFGKEKDDAKSSEDVLSIWENNKKKEKSQKSQTQAMKEITRTLPSLERAYKIQKKAKQVGFDWDDRSDVIKKIREEIDEVEMAVKDAKSEFLSTLENANSDFETAADNANSEIRESGDNLNFESELDYEKIKSDFDKNDINQTDDEIKGIPVVKKMKNSGKEEIELEIGDLLFAVVNYARFLDVNPEIALDKANQKFIRRFSYVETKVSENGKMMENCTLQELDMIWDEAKAKEKI